MVLRLAQLAVVVLACAALVACAALISGCGDDEGGDETVTVTEGATDEATTTATGPATDVETGTETGTYTVTNTDKAGPGFFSTPSGNIGCHVSGQGARCDIAERAWKPTPPPEPCELDYGQGIELFGDQAEFVCAGDTTLGAPKVLPYGEVSQRSTVRCESAEDGVTCSDTATGHGFFISKQSYRIF